MTLGGVRAFPLLELGVLEGASTAERTRFFLAQRHLLDLLRRDESVRLMFETWWAETSAPSRSAPGAVVLDSSVGPDSIAEGSSSADSAATQPRVQATAWVVGRGLRSEWLPDRLVDVFEVEYGLTGRDPFGGDDQPSTTLRFEPPAHELADVDGTLRALAQFRAAAERVERALWGRATALSLGAELGETSRQRAGSAARARVERAVSLFYRRNIAGASVRHLAKEGAEVPEWQSPADVIDASRRSVRREIDWARALLRL